MHETPDLYDVVRWMGKHHGSVAGMDCASAAEIVAADLGFEDESEADELTRQAWCIVQAALEQARQEVSGERERAYAWEVRREQRAAGRDGAASDDEIKPPTRGRRKRAPGSGDPDGRAADRGDAAGGRGRSPERSARGRRGAAVGSRS